jgi:hypothetical protein
MRVGILGSGLMGGKLGTLFARAGHDVAFSYARSQRKLERLARDAGKKARAGTPAGAALNADALLLAVHWLRIDDVLKQAGDLTGKVIVSCSLPINADNTELTIGRTHRPAPRSLPRKFRRRAWCAPSTPFRAKFCWMSMKRAARECGQASSIAATTPEAKKLQRSSFAMSASIR